MTNPKPELGVQPDLSNQNPNRSAAKSAGQPTPPPPITLRGSGSPASAKLVSFLISGPLLALTFVGVLLSSSAQLRLTQQLDRSASVAIIFLVGVALVVASAVLWAALARLSSVGPIAAGLLLLAVAIVAFFQPYEVYQFGRQIAEVVPIDYADLAIGTFVSYNGALLMGALLLGVALAAALIRRKPRTHFPEPLGH